MTAIAYRDGVMAADTLESAGGVLTGHTRKIVRTPDGSLVAAAGSATICHAFLEAAVSGSAENFRPDIKGDHSFSAILIKSSGAMWYFDDFGCCPTKAEFVACGCAHDMLIGAMAHGASASEAVAVAVKYDRRCGGEIQVERL